MNPRALMWSPEMESLGACCLAIGVFDGVHVGHQELLDDTVSDARKRDAVAVAVTFDRDPDQVVTPESAAPQLLTLDDKIACILSRGIARVLVVAFTPELAQTEPESFLEQVIGSCMDPLAVHVGENFRFGARAAGDLDTLYVWGVEHNVDVVPHGLVEVDGEAVSSTRIRGLVAAGDLAGVSSLLGRPHRIRGTVVRGRGAGAGLGFPTANVDPVAFSALPAQGVYAGIALLDDETRWPAAVSVGRPPTFPEATDLLEVHLIGYEGDLYGRSIGVDLIERLRGQSRFSSVNELRAAIAADVARVTQMASDFGLGADAVVDDPIDYADGELEFVSDPAALEAAQRAVDALDPLDAYERGEADWVPVMKPLRMSGIVTAAGSGSFAYAAALEGEGIPFVWDPYPPGEMPGFRPAYGAFDRPFTMRVPAEQLDQARRALAKAGLLERTASSDAGADGGRGSHAAVDERSSIVTTDDRRRLILWIVAGVVLIPLLIELIWYLITLLSGLLG